MKVNEQVLTELAGQRKLKTKPGEQEANSTSYGNPSGDTQWLEALGSSLETSIKIGVKIKVFYRHSSQL